MNFIDKLVQKHSSTKVAFILSLIIYSLTISSVMLYFNYKNENKPENYVKKNEKVISVSLKNIKAETKREIAKQSKKETNIEKRPVFKEKKKIVKKQKVKSKKPKPKKIKKEQKKKASDLFKNIKPTKTKKEKSKEKTKSKKIAKTQNQQKKNVRKKESASELINNTFKNKKDTQKGIEEEYLARVKEKLINWPAQSDYEGEAVKVEINIKKDGSFDFKIKRRSNNKDFNRSLKEYLDQLKEIGFGPHKSQGTYKVIVDFIAK